MTPFLPEALLAATVLLILIVVSLTGLWQPHMPAAGRRMITTGLSLLVVSALLHLAAHLMPLHRTLLGGSEALHQWVQELLLLIGFPLVAFGVVQIAMRMRGNERLRRLERLLGDATKELQSTHGMLNSMLRSSLSGIMLLKSLRDEGRQIVDFQCCLANDAATQLLGRSSRDLISRKIFDQFACLRSQPIFQSLVSVVESRLPTVEEHCFIDGQDVRWFQIAAVRHGDGAAVTFIDTTEQKLIEEQLRHAALHDSLTGLPNRTYFIERLKQSLHLVQTRSDHLFAVLFLDFDRFKVINDSLGHEVGDQLLISISERLRATLRAIDAGSHSRERNFPARLGGDEFVILLDGIREPSSAAIIAERLQKNLAVPHRIAGQEVTSTASIGIVTSHKEYTRAEDIIRDADTAMYQAKTSGRAKHVVFETEMHAAAVAQLQLETELRDAVERRTFLLEYQPIVSLADGHIAGFEALIRWPHPVRGLILPCEFIIPAEEMGLIVPIGQWVLEKACAAIQSWQARYPNSPPLTINVNLSRQEVMHESLVDNVRDVLERTGIPPETLHLEVTETMCMNNLDEIAPVLQQLKSLGIKLAMDDFGTGHSSLSCLDRFPFDILKIDQSFVRSSRKKRDFAAILRSMIELGQNLDLPVVVEGVETEDQLSLLQALDCAYGQGWLFGEAITADRVEKLLQREMRATDRRAA